VTGGHECLVCHERVRPFGQGCACPREADDDWIDRVARRLEREEQRRREDAEETPEQRERDWA
jgi:hypothetical protein